MELLNTCGTGTSVEGLVIDSEFTCALMLEYLGIPIIECDGISIPVELLLGEMKLDD